MLIKKESSKVTDLLLQLFSKIKKPILIFLPVGIVVGILLTAFTVLFIDKSGEFYQTLDAANTKFYQATGINVYKDILGRVVNFDNFIAGLTSKPERISIDIAFEDYRRLAYKRELALTDGILLTTEDDYVPATIRYKNHVIDVSLRLKSDLADQLEGEKWPFRIRVTGDNTLFGMKKFSIHKPAARNFLNEWVFHQALKREGIVSLRYDFIEVSINGDNKGIYALEEHFEKRLIEDNKYREGPILKLNADLLWADSATSHGQDLTKPVGIQSMYSADVDVFRKDSTIEDPVLFEQYILGMSLLESFRNGSLQTHQVFDVDKLAKFMALTDVLGAHHGLAWNNLRFYYNPVTSLLEPIGFDAEPGKLVFNSIQAFQKRIGPVGDEYVFPHDNNSVADIMFHDPVFYRRYIEMLERFSRTSYLDGLFAALEEGLRRNINILYKDNPVDVFTKNVFYSNQVMINEALNPYKGLHAYFYRDTETGGIILQLGNIQAIPIEIINVTYRDTEVLEPVQNTYILQAKRLSKPVRYEKIEFLLPQDFKWTADYLPNLKINYKLLGASTLSSEDIFPWPYISEDILADDFIRQPPNVENFDFLVVDDPGERILVKTGHWEVTESIIIPPGYTVVIRQGTELDLRNGARILSYSPLEFQGADGNPVVITSSDSSGEGITVLNAGKWSTLENVIFENLSAPSQGGWQLTGAVTFYESPVEINNCRFTGNIAGDDMLNIIRSDFSITGSLFERILFDALDIDFSDGKISRTAFIGSGNDAVDISGSVVDIAGITVRGAGDKGVSIGENSQVTMEDVKLENCYLAIASKDMSRVSVTDATITDCEIGLAVYQKKPEFGPSAMEISSYTMTDVANPYYREENSTLKDLLDGRNFTAVFQDVYRHLYGEE